MSSSSLSNSSNTPKKNKSNKKPVISRDSDDDSGDLIVDIEATPSISKVRTPSKPTTLANSTNKKRKKRDSASSDEERWLTAIESGKLEDVDDELKKIKPKDPSLMTARQRAMYDRSIDGIPAENPTLISLPTGYKEKVMTPEAIQKAAIKSQKRKQVADEKREKDKKKTLERLLKKQESKTLKSNKPKHPRINGPVITYKQNNDITVVTFPSTMDIPLRGKKVVSKPVAKYCSMNCGNLKKYSCSKTGAPLCSLECYKKNISSRIL